MLLPTHFHVLQTRGMLLDTNLLLVYLIGLYSPNLVGTVARTGGYSDKDFEILLNMIRASKQAFTTPQILAETSNFLENSSSDNLNYQNSLIDFVRICLEKFYETKSLIRETSYCSGLLKFGISDMSVLEVAKKEDCLVLTSDAPLYSYLLSQDRVCVLWDDIQQMYF